MQFSLMLKYVKQYKAKILLLSQDRLFRLTRAGQREKERRRDGRKRIRTLEDHFIVISYIPYDMYHIMVGSIPYLL